MTVELWAHTMAGCWAASSVAYLAGKWVVTTVALRAAQMVDQTAAQMAALSDGSTVVKSVDNLAES